MIILQFGTNLLVMVAAPSFQHPATSPDFKLCVLRMAYWQYPIFILCTLKRKVIQVFTMIDQKIFQHTYIKSSCQLNNF